MAAPNRYYALALQTTCHAINFVDDPKAQIAQSITRISQQIGGSKAFIGSDLRLVVLPEYFLTSFPLGESFPAWRQKGCIHPDGPEYQQLGEVARQHNIFLSGNVYELDDHFPELYFQTSFIINPQGEVILRYRRLNSLYAPTPHDVLEKYVDIYGYEALFPVADTEIGKLACIASEEILYPEVARCLMLRGAEVFLHSSSEVGSPIPTQKGIAKLARATENMAYVVSANSAGITGTPVPSQSTDGGSQIVDFNGIKQCEAGYGESMVAYAAIDIRSLREHRQRPGMANFIARQRLDLYAPSYANITHFEPNQLLDRAPDRTFFRESLKKTIERLNSGN